MTQHTPTTRTQKPVGALGNIQGIVEPAPALYRYFANLKTNPRTSVMFWEGVRFMAGKATQTLL